METFIHEEVYRGKKTLKKIADTNLIFCGMGAIGSNFAENAIRQGFKKIAVIDMDRIDDHNMHTQIWGRRDKGQLKATTFRNHMVLEMGIIITDISKKLDSDNISRHIKEGAIVIDGFDNSDSRRLVTEYCRNNKIECLHIGLFRDYAEVIWNDNYKVPKDTQEQDVCEYPLARNIIMLATTVGTESLIRYVDSEVKESYYITLKDLKITRKD